MLVICGPIVLTSAVVTADSWTANAEVPAVVNAVSVVMSAELAAAEAVVALEAVGIIAEIAP